MSRHKRKKIKINHDTGALNTSEIEESVSAETAESYEDDTQSEDAAAKEESPDMDSETAEAGSVPEGVERSGDTAVSAEDDGAPDESSEADGDDVTQNESSEAAGEGSSEEPAEAAVEEGSPEESAEVSVEEGSSEEPADVSEDESTSGETGEHAEDAGEEADSDDSAKEKSSSQKSRVSRNALREQSENERLRREARHRKRIRQQVTAYIILVAMIAVIGLGLFFGIRYFVNRSRAIREADAAAELAQQQQMEEEANAQTEPVVVPEIHTVDELGDTPIQLLDAEIEAEISQMTLEEKVQGIMFITPESITGVDRVVIAGDGTAAALSDFCPGGIVYSSKNVTGTDQFATMVSNTVNMVSRPVFFATGETGLNESGLVGTGAIESVLTPSQAAENGDVEAVVGVGASIGSGLAAVGINVDFAPVADLSVTAGGIGADASYGDDASAVTPYVTAMADGLSGSGVIPAYKYFPSLAASTQDPRLGRALSDRTLEDFRGNEFQIWLSAINAGAQMIQMSNVIYPSIDSDSLPSSLSEKCVTGVLRDELKYDGVIISGPLSDAAISEYYTASESAVMALKAGCDMIYSSPDPRAAVSGIMDGVSSGVISEDRIDDALIRIYRIRYADRLSELRAQYEADAAALGVDLTGVA